MNVGMHCWLVYYCAYVLSTHQSLSLLGCTVMLFAITYLLCTLSIPNCGCEIIMARVHHNLEDVIAGIHVLSLA